MILSAETTLAPHRNTNGALVNGALTDREPQTIAGRRWSVPGQPTTAQSLACMAIGKVKHQRTGSDDYSFAFAWAPLQKRIAMLFLEDNVQPKLLVWFVLAVAVI